MFLIKDKGVKALENNLYTERKENKKLKEQVRTLSLQVENLKVENLHYKQSSNAYKVKYEAIKRKVNNR